MDKNLLEHIDQDAKNCFKNAGSSHDWDHTLRVYRLCERLGPPAGADMKVLLIAACLHDIGRGYQDASKGIICHAEKGVEIAAPMIERLALNDDQKKNILHCIGSHRYRGAQKPLTTEAKVLFDADKLDAIGAIGVARAFQFAGELGARLHVPDGNPEKLTAYSENDTGFREYSVKLCKIKGRMLTSMGRQMAEERHAFMEAFFVRFLEEYQGKR